MSKTISELLKDLAMNGRAFTYLHDLGDDEKSAVMREPLGTPPFKPDNVFVEEASRFDAESYTKLLGRPTSTRIRSTPTIHYHTLKFSGGWDYWLERHNPLGDIFAMADKFGHIFLWSEREKKRDRQFVQRWFGNAILAINDNFGMQTEIDGEGKYGLARDIRASVRRGLQKALDARNIQSDIQQEGKGDISDGKERGTRLGYGIATEASGSLTRSAAWLRPGTETTTGRNRT